MKCFQRHSSVVSGEWRKIRNGPDGQEHQSNKKECGKNHNAINHFTLRNQVHKITRHKERLSASNQQGHADINGTMTKGNIGSSYRDQSPKKQRVEHEQVTPDMVTELFGRMVVAHRINQSKYKTGK